MFSSRSSHQSPRPRCHSRGSRSHGCDNGLGCGCRGGLDDFSGGLVRRPPLHAGHSLYGGRGGDRLGSRREAGGRLVDSRRLELHRDSVGGGLADRMGALGITGLGEGVGGMGGIGGRGSLGGMRGAGRGSLLDNLGPNRGSIYGRRGPILDDAILSRGGALSDQRGFGGPEMLTPREHVMGHFGSRASLHGDPSLGSRSRMGALMSGSNLDLLALDRQRMPYGSPGPRMPNYQQPYVEDFFSDIDVAEAMAEREALLEHLGGPWYDDPYGGDLGIYEG